jgi:predicted alpha/beta hydrolase family esterase
MKLQIVFIHGGDSFDTKEELYAALQKRTFDPYSVEQRKWRDWLKEQTSETHDFLYLQMPNAWSADYVAWSIWFEKVIPYLRDGVILIGHSLGGGFLLRYLTENKLPVSIAQLHLVAPVVDDRDCPGVGGFQIDIAHWSGFKTVPQAVHLWHSSDDTLVPLHHSERFATAYPTAILHTFTDRGHFLTESFPELCTAIGAGV